MSVVRMFVAVNADLYTCLIVWCFVFLSDDLSHTAELIHRHELLINDLTDICALLLLNVGST